MRLGTRSALLCVIGAAAWYAGAPAWASEARISRLLDEAKKATSLAAAKKKLDQAQASLDAARRNLRGPLGDFLEADIVRGRGEAALDEWRRAPKKAKPPLRREARRYLEQATRDYDRVRKTCEKSLQDIEDAFKGRDVSRDRKWQEASKHVSRARYQLAWQHYRVGDLADKETEADKRQGHFNKALEGFSYFTSFTDMIKHHVVFDCFLGHSLCLHELERYDELIESLEGDFKIEQQMRDAGRDRARQDALRRMMYLLVKGYDWRSRGKASVELEAIASQYLGALRPSHDEDVLDLEVAVIRARNLAALLKAGGPSLRRMAGAYRRALDQMVSLVELHGDPWLSDLDKALGRPPTKTPSREFGKAREYFNAKNYPKAIEVVDKALKAAHAGRRPAKALVNLYYVKAAALWNVHRWREAHLAAADFVRLYPNDRRAPEMCRRAVQAGLKAMKQEPPLAWDQFDRFLRAAKRAFPDEPELEKAPWFNIQFLIQENRHAEAERKLRRILPGKPLYRHAQYGLALVAHRRAEADGGPHGKNTASVGRNLEQGMDAIRRFAAAPIRHFREDEPRLSEAAVHVAHAIARSFLALPRPRWDKARRLLDRLDASDTLGHIEAGQRRALRLEVKMLAGGLDQAWELIDSSMKRLRVEPHVAQAIARIADRLDRDWSQRATAQTPTQLEQRGRRLVRIYEFLLREMRRRSDDAAGDQELNLRRRLGRTHLRLRDYREAIRHSKWVESKWPAHQAKPADVLRTLAVAYEETERYESAIQRWRTLARGLKAKTEGWYEARYHWILCCHKAQKRTTARKLLGYFELRYPTIGSAAWKEKFEELGRELGKE